MRVLYLCYRGNPFCGGQGIYLSYLTKELSKLGVETDIIIGPPYPENIDGWADVYKIENDSLWYHLTRKVPLKRLNRVFTFWGFIDYFLTRIHMFPEMETFSFRSFFFMKKLLKQKHYDIIHDIQCLGWGLLPMKGYGIPIVSTVHHPLTRDRDADFQSNRKLWDFFTTIMFYPITMQRKVINRLDRVITSSYEGVDELDRAFGLPASRISVVYNGMDVDEFSCHGLKREDRAILYVGNTEDRKKGISYLIEAFAGLPEDITLTIVDEGPPKGLTVYNLCKKLGIKEGRVKFTGRLDNKDLVYLYNTKTILVMSSLYEGFGLPAAEAMACEMPVIATSAGALTEVVGSDGAGILVPPEDAESLQNAIVKLLGDRELRIKMGKIGRKRAVDNFAWPAAARNTLEVYKNVIEEYGNKK